MRSDMRPFFRPAIAAMNRLSYPAKFGLVWLLSAVAIGFVIVLLYASLTERIRQGEQELQGIALATPISRSVQLIQKHRGLAQGFLGGQAEMGEAVARTRNDALDALRMLAAQLPDHLKASKDWQNIEALKSDVFRTGQAWPLARSFDEHTRLIDRLLLFKVVISGEYQLALDPQIDSSHLIDAAMDRLPLALEHLGQIRAQGTQILARGRIGDGQAIFLRSTAAQLSDELRFIRADLERARTHNPALDPPLLMIEREVTDSVQQIVNLFEWSVLSGRMDASPEQFFGLTTAVLDQSYRHLHESLLPTLEGLVQGRIAQARRILFLTLGMAGLLFVLVIYFSIGAYYATTENIDTLARAAKALAGGRIHERVRLETRDELHQVGNSFNEMAQGFSLLLAARAEDERRHHSVIESAMDAMVQVDDRGCITDWNPQATRLFGWQREEALGQQVHDLLFPEDQRKPHKMGLQRFLLSTDGAQAQRRFELSGVRRDGSVFPMELSTSVIKTEGGHLLSAFIRDITEKKASEALIWRQANFDELTGLPNRRMFYNRLEQELKRAERARQTVALLFVDLDRFKEVNDTLGHRIGDALLVEAAKRIQGCVRDCDTVARLGGDEFVIVLDRVDGTPVVDRIASQILERLAEVFKLDKEVAFVTASIGVTFYPQDATRIEDLLKDADQAMYLAKASGRNRFSYFTPELQNAAQDRLRLLNDLREALAAQQFEIHYQPIVDLASGCIWKAEALIRWHHPERGTISPAQFIPLAEETGLIVPIGDWVFKEATGQIKRWQVEHGWDIQVSVNKSPIQFKSEPCGSQAWLEHLHGLGLDASRVVIEITEGLLLHPEPEVTARLAAFRDAGIQISIDDFGTGYSSLSYLRSFEFDYLKIDRSFTRNLRPDSSEMTLCEAIIVMAHKLGMKVIAEGVESDLQRALLVNAGCDYAQGYLFSRPVPAREFAQLLPCASCVPSSAGHPGVARLRSII